MKLIRQLLLQLTVVLLRIYLGQEEALRAGEARAKEAWLGLRTLSCSSSSPPQQPHPKSVIYPLPLDLGTLRHSAVSGCFRPKRTSERRKDAHLCHMLGILLLVRLKQESKCPRPSSHSGQGTRWILFLQVFLPGWLWNPEAWLPLLQPTISPLSGLSRTRNQTRTSLYGCP